MKDQNLEKLSGVVERITYHNEQNGWSVIKVSSFKSPGGTPVTVVVHQAQVFAGATMEFWGTWTHHPKYGQQFKAQKSLEKKPASTAALEKYLGSGLIKGVREATAKKIVKHFKERTLEVFENSIDELMSVPGVTKKKLEGIKNSWHQHQAIKDVMIFLQKYGVSTLFATKIFKAYGDKSIEQVSQNPYRLALDIYGIGFFSADQIALSMGFSKDSSLRLEAGIRQALASSREEGHCFLTQHQIVEKTLELLRTDFEAEKIISVLEGLLASNQVKVRELKIQGPNLEKCYYSKTLFFDEVQVSKKVSILLRQKLEVNSSLIKKWVEQFCQANKIQLSKEQKNAVCCIPEHSFSILTGGPGCGKTTCTKVLVRLLEAMKLKVTLAAPTGRAAQRMMEVMGVEAKTIHRLLEWSPFENQFKCDENNSLETNFLILDEVSMLDISLASSVFKAIPQGAQVLFIGDPDQLPAVGAGNVLRDLLNTQSVPRFVLTQIFRQAQESSIIRFAHEINLGVVPKVTSLIKDSQAFNKGQDCLFADADEATQEQVKFMRRVNQTLESLDQGKVSESLLRLKEDWVGRIKKSETGVELDHLYRPEYSGIEEAKSPVLIIPEKFKNVDLLSVAQASSEVEQLKAVLKYIHPWSSLKYGMTAVDTLVHLYTQTIPRWFGKPMEIQVLSPQLRGTMGTLNLNSVLQNASNPEDSSKKQLKIGDRIFRQGDRVIQTRNNYDLEIFNGDIGKVVDLTQEGSCIVDFYGGQNDKKRVSIISENLIDLQLAYAITIHKSQGSEFDIVIIPIMGQHFNMLYRNLVYTGLTRAKRLAVFVGSRKALSIAIKQVDHRVRQTALTFLVDRKERAVEERSYTVTFPKGREGA